MKLTFTKEEGTQTIEQLWLSVANLSANIVEDNKHPNYNSDYPLSLRRLQLTSIKALVTAIELTHNKGECL